MNVNQSTESSTPLFLNISILRLVLLSIASCGLYEAYWIYKNWRYIKERDGLEIRPFWRGFFCVFFCHSLLHRIHGDRDARLVKIPTFSYQLMATGWVALVICSRIVNRIPGPESTVISAFIPSFLFLIPIQNYVNMVEIERNPNHKLYGWSFGHTVCLGLGISIWISTLGEIATRILGSSF